MGKSHASQYANFGSLHVTFLGSRFYVFSRNFNTYIFASKLFILFWNTKCFHPYCKRIYFIFRHTGIRPDKLLFIHFLFALLQSNGKFVRQFKSYD